jgi:hypothetical protein
MMISRLFARGRHALASDGRVINVKTKRQNDVTPRHQGGSIGFGVNGQNVHKPHE